MRDAEDDARAALLAELRALDVEDAGGAEARRTVTPDLQSVGRLSRMDEMPGQAMAQAALRHRAARRQRIAATLTRMEDGEFGFCTECGEGIAQARLRIDPTTPMCLSCASG